ncbi:hypothetical protein JHN55_28445 [Streptomyces sp. MBT56]|uniref:hypothetical protein n=1 Tax=unclassified Streptomyces TaxID=2593676 RepID=UPI001909E9EF|nr:MULTISPECIES: hypothetical protein [unclassified Streptomyces]MBK3534792.1 hypothetical protein [Streptomyces sp. MBT67]MBK3560387.1 hypothetical protein [Streptomyces sp. MBT56]MBK3600052.1 hypothetical protein [Streptomyces sp. MBT54]MBK3613307.1 hypothetical protein [Streptomyces sp. MBT98]
MHPDQSLVSLRREVAAVTARTSTPPPPLHSTASAPEREHGYGHLTAPLRQRGLECTVEYGLSDYIVHVALPDGSSLIVSPPQEPSTDHPPGHPESWLVTRGHPNDSTLHEVIYDSEPDGPHARHGGSVPKMLAAVDARLDQLDVPPRPGSASPRVTAALALSPTAQRTSPAPLAASAVRPALPAARTPSVPGR